MMRIFHQIWGQINFIDVGLCGHKKTSEYTEVKYN
jgi:hypothetical protein